MNSSEIALSTRTSVGLYPLPQRGLLEVQGGDGERWLNGMITNDVRSLAVNSQTGGCHAMVLDRKGAILADLLIWARPDSLLLETDVSNIEELAIHFRKFIIADDVQLIPKTAEQRRISLEGPKSFDLLQACAALETSLAPWQEVEAVIEGCSVSLLGVGLGSDDGVQLLMDAASEEVVLKALRQAGEKLGFFEGKVEEKIAGKVEETADALEILRIEAGRPALQSELLPKVFPQEARLESAISTTKGCYIGQEITARLASRGHVNRLLVGLQLPEGSTLPAPGTELSVDGKKVGKVTSSTHSPHVGKIALAMVRTEHTEPGSKLQWEGGEEACVTELPFFPSDCPSDCP